MSRILCLGTFGILSISVLFVFVMTFGSSSRRVRSLRLLTGLLLAILLVGLISCMGYAVGDGGYNPNEFQVTFIDQSGKPVEGVELRVEDREGHPYFHYPVTDYLPDQIPTSDRDGVIVFHHVARGLEFSIVWFDLFFLIPIDEKSAPYYVCRFLHDGKEVHRVPYHELDDLHVSWDEAPKVKRIWRWSSWPASQLEQPEKTNGGSSRERWRTFDVNGNGKMDVEEGPAFTAAMSFHDEAIEAKLSREKPEREIEFRVVRRTFRIQLQGR